MDNSLEEAWPICKGQFVYLKADDLAQWPANQTMEPLTESQPKTLEVFKSFQLSPKKEGDPEVVLDYLEGHCRPHHSKAYKRFLFRTRFQELHEPFENFVADLHYKSHFCNFGDQRESMVRDQVIMGCRDSLVRQHLLDHDNLGLEEALQICRQAEEKQSQHTKDSCRHPITSSDEEKTLFQKGDVKERKPTRRKARRVRKMAKKPNHWSQEVGNCPRKESFKTYV
ncbi:hypothetical protein L345_04607, partial [Ophiophagus hannah]